MRRWWAQMLLLLASVAAGLLVVATAAQSAEPPFCTNGSCPPGSVTSNGNSLDVAASRVSDSVPNRDKTTPGGPASRASTWVVVDEYVTPTCMGNGLQGVDALCAMAVTSCGEGLLRYWIWQREITYTREPPSEQATPWEQLPGSYCLGPDDPGVPDYGRAISIVQSGFRNLPLPKADVQVAPTPTSLVQVPTAFYAGGQQSFSQTVTPIRGVTITVTAKPTSWTWRWGDGTSSTVSTPGRPRDPLVSHVYTQARDHSADVVVSWSGSFTIAGSTEVFDIPTPARVTSAPITVQVRQARTELVED